MSILGSLLLPGTPKGDPFKAALAYLHLWYHLTLWKTHLLAPHLWKCTYVPVFSPCSDVKGILTAPVSMMYFPQSLVVLHHIHQ